MEVHPPDDCQKTRQHTGEFLDGELDPELTLILQKHIQVCGQCGLRVSFEAAFLRSVSRCKVGEPLPTGVHEKITMILTDWRNRDA